MAKQKSLVEEAIIQMKNLEEAITENAKGILASTMKGEIKELVKESLTEQEEKIDTEIDTTEPENDEVPIDGPDMEDDDDEIEDPDMEDDDSEDEMEIDNEMEPEVEDDMEDETIDLTGESDDVAAKVFVLSRPEDKILVKKDAAGNINLKDEESNKEYLIMKESEDEEYELEEQEDFDYESDNEFEDESDDESDDESEDEFEDEFEDESDDEVLDLRGETDIKKISNAILSRGPEDELVIVDDDEDFIGEQDDIDDEGEMDRITDKLFSDDEDEETLYEIELEDDGMEEEDLEEGMEEDDMKDDDIMEGKKMMIKPKGKTGSGPKFKYHEKPNMNKGFKTKMKEGPKTTGTGKAKFEYKEGENLEGKMKPVKSIKKAETKEAARTLGAGSNFRKGGLPKPRAHSKLNISISEGAALRQINLLKEKNEEYKKALNVFRDKLNEVAVFNSNLAYATRLFTEHTTSKQEKINILRRFDGVESIKESKSLYKIIKDELLSKSSKSITESVETKLVDKTPSNGSSTNLIESKTYEHPQFLRMKDLMSKLNK